MLHLGPHRASGGCRSVYRLPAATRTPSDWGVMISLDISLAVVEDTGGEMERVFGRPSRGVAAGAAIPLTGLPASAPVVGQDVLLRLESASR